MHVERHFVIWACDEKNAKMTKTVKSSACMELSVFVNEPNDDNNYITIKNDTGESEAKMSNITVY